MQSNNIILHRCICICKSITYIHTNISAYSFLLTFHMSICTQRTYIFTLDRHTRNPCSMMNMSCCYNGSHDRTSISRLPSSSCRSTLKTTLSQAYRIPWPFKRRCGRGWSLRRCTCIGLCRGPDTAVAHSRHWYVALVCGYGGWPLSALNCLERRWPHRMARILHLDMHLHSICFMSQFRHQFEDLLTFIMFCGSGQPVRQPASCVRCTNVPHLIPRNTIVSSLRISSTWHKQSRTTYTNTNYETRSFIP